VAALPGWLVAEYREMKIVPVRLGKRGIPKKIYLGVRSGDEDVDFIAAFIELAATKQPTAVKRKARKSESHGP